MNATQSRVEIKALPGPQTAFLSSPADIVVYGGGAGGGKTRGLLLEAVRHTGNSDFGAVIFRRVSPQIRNEGGLWDESQKFYPLMGARPKESTLEWIFPSDAKIKFAQLQHETDKNDWQGAQIALIGFDELTHFTESQFFYMLSRNRSTCGIAPYVRATCNPDADSWVAKLIEWWIDQETGLAIPERSGVIRYFVRQNDIIVWADSREEIVRSYPEVDSTWIKSLTFIPSSVFDNPILLKVNPQYLGNLYSLPLVERERLLGCNWKIKPTAGKIFNRGWFEIVDAAPVGGDDCRFWDFAATEPKMGKAGKTKKKDPDYTAGCKIRFVNGITYILDAVADQLGPTDADNLVYNTATQDGRDCLIRWEEEGGASGKRDSAHIAKKLAGFDVRAIRPQGDKIRRAKPLAAQAEAGNVKLVRGDWNERWLTHMHGQPELTHDDEMDAASGAFNVLTGDGAAMALLSDMPGAVINSTPVTGLGAALRGLNG